MLFLDIVFFAFFHQFGPFWGPQMGPKTVKKLGPVGPGSEIKTDLIFLTTFWRPQGSILADLGAIWGDFLTILGLNFGLDFGTNFDILGVIFASKFLKHFSSDV